MPALPSPIYTLGLKHQGATRQRHRRVSEAALAASFRLRAASSQGTAFLWITGGKPEEEPIIVSRSTRIHTIGYQQRAGLDLVGALIEAHVEFLVDIRAVPMSRKPDFRKNRLIALLEEGGIRYLGMPGLGTPKFLRDKLAADGNYGEFFDIFRHHLTSVSAHVESLARLADRKRVSLMCFERDANECHRLAVADQLSSMLASPVLHL